MNSSFPIIGIMADYREEDGRPWIKLPAQYLQPVERLCSAIPILIPPLETINDDKLSALLSRIDGMIFSGSPSNIHPSHYQQEWQTPDLPQDVRRDATSLALVSLLLKRRIPIFAICRGFQEINVALGGTLHQKVHEVSSYHDHRAPPGQDIVAQFDHLQHEVRCVEGGYLAEISPAPTFRVNSLHGQGIDKLAPSLQPEAYADDGLIEAYSLPNYPFLLAAQWHPEWSAETNPQSCAMFAAFGEACRCFHHQI